LRFLLERRSLERKLLERKLSERSPGKRPKHDVNGCSAHNGNAVTFIVHASRDEAAMTTVRLSAAAAIARGWTLADQGWQVVITGPDGIRHSLSEFDALSRSGAPRSRS
jgi:hypothetical protein